MSREPRVGGVAHVYPAVGHSEHGCEALMLWCPGETVTCTFLPECGKAGRARVWC